MAACAKRKAMYKMGTCGAKIKSAKAQRRKVEEEMIRSQILSCKSEIYANTTVINLSNKSENVRVFLFTTATRVSAAI